MVTALLLLAALAGAARHPSPSAPPAAPARTLVWAIDGLSFDAFAVAQQRGLFRRFRFSGRHVAPYPSMSHPAWTEITGARRLFGARGNIGTVEARWFDLDAMRVEDDPRQVFARQAAPFNYMRAFDWFFDPLSEPLMYFKGQTLADRELAEAERHVLDHFRGAHQVVFVGGADAIAHTQRGLLYDYLRRLDAMMSRVADSLDRRGGAPVEHWIISDHGNTGAFAEGARERYLTPVSLAAAFRRARLVRRDTGALTHPDQAAVVTIALANMVNVYFADLTRRRAFALAAGLDSAVELVTWLEVRDDDRWVVVHGGARGEAELRWRTAPDGTLAYAYTRITGNPLALPDSFVSRGDVRRWIPDPIARQATMYGPYPDALHRLVRSALKDVANAPDLIVNLREGFCWAGDFGALVRMVRTHGSLGARATLGLVASTATPIPEAVRSAEVLALTGLSPDTLFRRVLARAPHEATTLADSLAAAPLAIPTGRDDDTPDASFLRRIQPLVRSTGFFDQVAMRALFTKATTDATTGRAREGPEARLRRSREAVRASDPLRGVTRNVDPLLAFADSLRTTLSDAAAATDRTAASLLDRTQSQLRAIPELAPLATLRDLWAPRGGADRSPGRIEPLRRALMTAWSVPFFLEAALDAPEHDVVDDRRDRAFAQRWHRRTRAHLRERIDTLWRDSTLAPRLFAEVMAERQLTRAVEQANVPRLYDAALPDVAVLYVPGIFGELFDDEIWRRGLHAAREQLGVRVVPVAADGRCSEGHNATRILAAMREDTQRRLARGYARPQYIIMGYSKGGVDATEALVRDTALARAQVAALVTIAAPHGGSPVAERSDIPEALLALAVARPRPPSCDTTHAVESLWPANRAAFWNDRGRLLDGLVPLVSVSLTSELREAHPWMKITKRIARFSESNDGVVARSASRFPSAVASVDLGAVEGDHIAGRVASAFPQESFVEALLLTLNELGLVEPAARARWRTAVTRERTEARARAVATPARAPGREPGPSAGRQQREPLRIPGQGIGWRPDRTFKMSSLESLAEVSIPDLTPSDLPDGLVIRCDHPDMRAFRQEYEFLYDAGNGGSEGDPGNGFSMVETDSTESGRACRFRTHRSAMKMTSASLRFRADALPELSLRLRVQQAVTGVAPDRGGRGRNDASLKLWLVLRDERPASRGKRLLFGYSWAGVDADGRVPRADSLVEASASRRRVGLSTLPEAWLITVGGPEQQGRWFTVRRDLSADLRRAFPGIPLSTLRVLAVTLQSDSDDSRGDTEVLIDGLAFRTAAAGDARRQHREGRNPFN
jgi:hypothetical protein